MYALGRVGGARGRCMHWRVGGLGVGVCIGVWVA